MGQWTVSMLDLVDKTSEGIVCCDVHFVPWVVTCKGTSGDRAWAGQVVGHKDECISRDGGRCKTRHQCSSVCYCQPSLTYPFMSGWICRFR